MIQSFNGKDFSKAARSSSLILQNHYDNQNANENEASPVQGLIKASGSQNKETNLKLKQRQPFSKILGREFKEKQKELDLFGMYDLKYDQVYKNTKSVPKRITQAQEQKQEVTLTKVPSFVDLRPKYIIEFKKQLGRRTNTSQVHLQSQHYCYALPSIVTNVQKVRNVFFDKTKRDLSLNNANISGLFYTKNYNQIEQRKDIGIRNFSRVMILTIKESKQQVSRSSISKLKPYTDSYTLLLNPQQPTKNNAVRFEKMMNRDRKASLSKASNSNSQTQLKHSVSQENSLTIPCMKWLKKNLGDTSKVTSQIEQWKSNYQL